jgi:ribosomal protein S18 acetylase RimI-like enzyme
MRLGLLAARLLPLRPREEEDAAALELPPAPVEPPAPIEPPAPPAPKPRTRNAADRRIALLRRCGLFSDDHRGARITRAATLEDLRSAYKLVHSVYLGTGYIPPERGDIRLRIFETSSETATFVAKHEGRVVGVISVIRDSEYGLPSDASFRPELDALRAQDKYLSEVTNQVVDPAFRETGLPTALIRCAVGHGIEAGFDEGIAAVSPSHNSFYEMLGFRLIGTERSYSQKVHDPVVLLSMDVDYYRRPFAGDDAAAEFVYRFLSSENHFRAYVDAWEKRAERNFLSAELLESLFISERNFLEECTPEELEILHRRWGSEMFKMVAGGNLFLPSPRSPLPVQTPPPESTPVIVGLPLEEAAPEMAPETSAAADLLLPQPIDPRQPLNARTSTRKRGKKSRRTHERPTAHREHYPQRRG